MMESELRAKVKRDARSQLIDDALIDALKARYNVSNEQPALDYFKSIINEDFYKKQWALPEDFDGKAPLVKIGTKQLTYQNFGNFLLNTQRKLKVRHSFPKIINDAYETFLSGMLKKYQEDNLEVENEDFANIVTEYRDGLLLFDLMETEIWNAAKEDSVGLQTYFNANKEKYFWDQRIDAIVASSAKKKDIKTVAKLLEEGNSTKEITAQLNTGKKVGVLFSTGKMDASHQALPKDFSFKTGISKIYEHNGAYVVALVNEVLPKTYKTFDQSKGKVISDFQTYKEENWLKTLSEKYTVKIDDAILNKVKSQIQK